MRAEVLRADFDDRIGREGYRRSSRDGRLLPFSGSPQERADGLHSARRPAAAATT